MSNPPTKFWEFSLNLYAKPGVSEACLQLQNSFGLDVNLVLFCLWFGHKIGKLKKDILQKALTFSQPWKKEVVQPLRDTRSWMKASHQYFSKTNDSQFHELRERIKLEELAAEKYQQQVLEAYALADELPSEKIGFKAAEENLNRYLAAIGIQRETSMNALLLKINRASDSI